MGTKSTLTNIKLENLKLDVNNPRFAELYSGSDKEEELVEYLLYSESAEDVAKGIARAGEFYPDRPLWVLKNGDSYVVKDGNRRCAAVKALQFPTKYGLDLEKSTYSELPVLIYNNSKDLESRILQEHTNSLFKEWDRIAKALEAYKLFSSGNSLESMKEIDSQPAQLIKLASFYFEAVKTGGEELKKLLRRGRGKTGGKTIIFERLFKFSKSCGYYFKNKPSNEIRVIDETKFKSYISAMVKYLKEFPETKTQDIDNLGEDFLKKLEPYGFLLKSSSEIVITNTANNSSNSNTNNENQSSNSTQSTSNNTQSNSVNPNNPSTNSSANSSSTNNANTSNAPVATASGQQGKKRKSIKDTPSYTRKRIPVTLEKLIRECYTLDQSNFSNAKTALTRVTFECTLKYVVENTLYNNTKNIAESHYFRNVFYDGSGHKKPYADFTKLKSLFSLLITNTGIRKAFDNFDLEKPHQIIHNYHVGALPADAKGLCDNLVPLLDFMLQEENDLLGSLDTSKL